MSRAEAARDLGPSACPIHRSAWNGRSTHFALTAFWEVRREPVLPLPEGGWHVILASSHLTPKGEEAHERRVG